ncbi:MAG TPA: fluoride efflux transporter CrcB [Solirubrobacteraceae bacterium]|jgi:CrcB protein
MSVLIVIAVGLVGGIGAIARFALDGAVSRRVGRDFPFGTLAVNLSGAFALGVAAGAVTGANAYRVIGTGLIGAFTTFSTWTFESHRLGEDGELRLGAVNFVVSLALGVLSVWVGRQVGTWL